MKELFVLAILVIVTGCAPTMKMVVNGYAYPTDWVKTMEDIDKKVSEETKAGLETGDLGAGSGIKIIYINRKYLPAGDTYMTMKGGGWENIVGAKLSFSRKIEKIKMRNEIPEAFWNNDVYAPAIKGNPLASEVCKTYWSTVASVSNTEKHIIYSKDFKNYSLLTDFVTIGVKYTDKAKELPLDDVCSVKSAELYLVELAKDVAARTEEYIKK